MLHPQVDDLMYVLICTSVDNNIMSSKTFQVKNVKYEDNFLA